MSDESTSSKPKNPTRSKNESLKPIHLVILIHGLFGSPANVATVSEELYRVHGSINTTEEVSEREGDEVGVEVQNDGETGADIYREVGGVKGKEKILGSGKDRKDELVVYCCNSFGFGHTWDGIDVNAQRAAKEVDDEVKRLEEDEGRTVGSISILGYSLGGLIARYLVGILHSRSPGFFEKRKPAAFVTVATPHLGTLKYGTTTNKIIHTIGRRLFSRSGRQLYCDDRDEDEKCLLEVMADPDSIFIHALQSFNKVLIVANGCQDLTVPYPTASISLSDPYQDYASGVGTLHIDVDERNIVTSYRNPISSSTTPRVEGSGGENTVGGDGEREGVRTGEVLREEDDGDIIVTVTTTTSSALRLKGGKELPKLPSRPMFPPFFYLRWPFTYALFFILPFLVPLWICFIVGFTSLQSYRSSKRHKLLNSSGEHTPLLSTPILLNRPKHRAISSLRTSPDRQSSGTSTPPFEEVLSPSSSKIPLYLTQKQEGMVRNLNGALPDMERIVAWFPEAFNSHAVLIMRDYKRFPTQEKARGVIREIAGRILDSA